MNAYFAHLLEDERTISAEFSGLTTLDGLGLDVVKVAHVAEQIYEKICAGADWEEGLINFDYLYSDQGRSRTTSLNTILQSTVDDFWK